MKLDQLCVNTMCYTAFDLEQALAGIGQTGIERVELCASVGYCDHAAPERLGSNAAGQLTGVLEKHGLRAVSFSAHGDITTQLGLDAFNTRLQLTADLGLRVTIAAAPDTGSPPDVAKQYRRTICGLADRAADLGITLCLESFGLYMNTARSTVDFFQALDHPNLLLNYDPAARIYCGGDLPVDDEIAVMAGHLGHIHLNNKASLRKQVWDFCPVPDGIVDWYPLLAELDRADFTGPASIEIGWTQTPQSIDQVNDAVRRSYEHVLGYFGGH